MDSYATTKSITAGGRTDLWTRDPRTQTEQIDQIGAPVVSLPMVPGNRSLNLSNCVSIVAFEAWKRCDFIGGITD